MSEVEKHYGAEQVPHPSGRPEPEGGGRVQSTIAAAGRAADQVRGSVGDAVGQARTWSRDRYESASTWASDTYESAARSATYAKRRTAVHVGRGQRTVEDFVEENPIMVGVVGLAAGLLIGALLPGTRRENRYLGPYADDFREQGMRYAQDVVEQGRHLVEDNLTRMQAAARDGQT